MKKEIIWIVLIIVIFSGCGNVLIEEKETEEKNMVTLTRKECDYLSGYELDCKEDYSNRTFSIITVMESVISAKKNEDEKKYEEYIGEFIKNTYRGNEGWESFKKSDIIDEVNGYIKIKYCSYNCFTSDYPKNIIETWFSKDEVIFYKDFNSYQKERDEQKINDFNKQEKRKKEIEKLFEEGKNKKFKQ